MYIRNAEESDLAAIVRIYNETIPTRQVTADTEPISVASRLAWFHSRDLKYRPIWVVEIDNNLVAWLSFQSFYGRPAYQKTAELSLYVASAYRRRGIGSTLLQKAITEATQFQIKTLLGFIFAHNQPSLELFKLFGFTQWGYLPEVAELDRIKRDLVILGLSLG
ncbi:MAG TPA: GNAT family N-acetyltransferase [Xenococcaceae cyanobacterium]